MNRNKLDKLVDQIFSEMGELEEGNNVYYGLLDRDGNLICYRLTTSFRVMDYVPYLEFLNGVLDSESFKYVMDQVGNRLINLYPDRKRVPVEYKELKGLSYIFDYIG